MGRLLPLDRWLAGVPPGAAHVGKVLPGSAFWRLLGAGRLLGAKTWLGPCLGLSRLLKALGPAQGANHLAGALLGALAAACKKWGKAVMRPLGYRMEMALPLARVSSPVRH